MKVEIPKEMNSPRAVLAFSFLSGVNWLKSKLRLGLRKAAERTLRSHELAAPGTRKHPHPKRAVVFLVAFALIGATRIALAHNSNQFVPRFQEFSDPSGSFANLNLGGPTDTDRKSTRLNSSHSS